MLSRAFIVTQVALACALLVGATLLVRSFLNLSRVDPGFNPSGILSLTSEPDRTRFLTQPPGALCSTTRHRELASLPGVSRVVRSNGVPLFSAWGTTWDDLEPVEPGGVLLKDARFHSYNVGPDWFDMFGVRIIRGREFAAGEDDRHVIVGAHLASALWPTRRSHWPIVPVGQGSSIRSSVSPTI